MRDAVRHCTFSARLDCHYQLLVPEVFHPGTCLVVALHGFGQNAETMLRLMPKLMGSGHVIAALEAPYQFFLPERPCMPREVGFCWVTNRHAPGSIRLHHDMVTHVLNEVGREYAIPPGRRLLAGFSQPVSLNYRFAATYPDALRGVIGMCGGLPGDWETANYAPARAAVLHIARREDEYYPPAVTEHYAAKLRMRVEDVEFHMIEGGHRFPSSGNLLVEGWLARILR